uniref:Ig-like domain-containing protein n=1 Tax=Denticeps clupeoides TaxID=299321 RepID=A0AAY4AHT3_9TELE
ALPTPALTVDPQNLVFTGEKVTLKCEVKPSSGWRYKWYKEESSNVFQSEGNTFIITAASGSDEGRYWSSGSDEVLFYLIKYFMPHAYETYNYTLPTATLTVASQSPVWTGDTVTLRCEVTSLTGWRYKWYKGRSQTAVSQSDRYNRTGDTLTIRGAAESDQDQYWCQGERDTRPTSSLINPQSPVFTGEKVTLKCEVKPSSGWRYKWYKEQSSNVVFQSEENTFIITAVSGSDQGWYWCRGEREHSNTNTPKSRDVYLSVKVVSMFVLDGGELDPRTALQVKLLQFLTRVNI